MSLYDPHYLPEVPKSPECYTKAHLERINDFPEETEEPIDPYKLKNPSQDDRWRYELDQ